MNEVHAFIREDEVDKMISEAEACGYAKAIDEAAAAIKSNIGLYTTKTAQEALNFALLDILALREKP